MKILLLIIAFSLGLSSWAQTSADSLALVGAQWDILKVGSGLRAMHCQFPMLYRGAQDVYMLEIKRSGHTFEMLDHQVTGTTSHKADSVLALAAINGTYFDMGKSERSVCFVAHQGKVVEYSGESMGQLTNGAVVMRGNRLKIVPWNVNTEQQLYPGGQAISSLRNQDVMVSGPLLLLDGQRPTFRDESHIMGKHPRSAIACRDNKVYLIVVDGRAPHRALGVTIPELAHMLQVLQMQEAINLDGGGSSTLWARPRFPSERTCGILNHPCDRSGERSVSNSIVVLGK